jgi:hypothetical protein
MGVHDNTDEYSNETQMTPLLYAPLGMLKWGQLTGGTKSNIHRFISDISGKRPDVNIDSTP